MPGNKLMHVDFKTDKLSHAWPQSSMEAGLCRGMSSLEEGVERMLKNVMVHTTCCMVIVGIRFLNLEIVFALRCSVQSARFAQEEQPSTKQLNTACVSAGHRN